MPTAIQTTSRKYARRCMDANPRSDRIVHRPTHAGQPNPDPRALRQRDRAAYPLPLPQPSLLARPAARSPPAGWAMSHGQRVRQSLEWPRPIGDVRLDGHHCGRAGSGLDPAAAVQAHDGEAAEKFASPSLRSRPLLFGLPRPHRGMGAPPMRPWKTHGRGADPKRLLEMPLIRLHHFPPPNHAVFGISYFAHAGEAALFEHLTGGVARRQRVGANEAHAAAGEGVAGERRDGLRRQPAILVDGDDAVADLDDAL